MNIKKSINSKVQSYLIWRLAVTLFNFYCFWAFHQLLQPLANFVDGLKNWFSIEILPYFKLRKTLKKLLIKYKFAKLTPKQCKPLISNDYQPLNLKKMDIFEKLKYIWLVTINVINQGFSFKLLKMGYFFYQLWKNCTLENLS